MGSDIKTKLIKNWKIKADNDLKIVEIGLNSDEFVGDILCFHCQQSVEKYLKLFLIYHDKDFPKTHNISILLENCKKIDLDFNLLQDVVYLTEYAVEVRYPDDFYIPDIDEARNAYQKAIKVKKIVSDKLVF